MIVIHYLDDFLVIEAPGSDNYALALRKSKDFDCLGIPIALKNIGTNTATNYPKHCSQ